MRMKTIIFFILVFINVVNAQTSNSGYVIWGGGGLAIPINEKQLTDSFKTAFNLNFSVGYVFNERLQLRADYQYNRFKNKSNSNIIFPEIGIIGKLTVNSYKLDFLMGSFRKCGCIQHYGLVGIGLYSVNITKKINNDVVSDSEVYLGFGGGFGFSFRIIGTIRLFMEGQYNYIFNDGTAKGYIPVKAGLLYQLGKKE